MARDLTDQDTTTETEREGERDSLLERFRRHRDPASGGDDDASITRHEEELQLGTRTQTWGTIRARTRVEGERVDEYVPRQAEYADETERVEVTGEDSGEVEVLADGSVSIPLFEEELVVEKRLRVRERVIIRKHTRTEQHHVEAELRREHIEVDADDGVLEEPDAALDE